MHGGPFEGSDQTLVVLSGVVGVSGAIKSLSGKTLRSTLQKARSPGLHGLSSEYALAPVGCRGRAL